MHTFKQTEIVKEEMKAPTQQQTNKFVEQLALHARLISSSKLLPNEWFRKADLFKVFNCTQNNATLVISIK